jgi:hypothetical protein
MNGELEKRLSNHIEEGAAFQGKMNEFLDNFNKRVLPSLVTSKGCDARHSALKAELADDERDDVLESQQRWRNRLWGALMAIALFALGAGFDTLVRG